MTDCDVEELRELVTELEAALEEVRAFGTENDIPAIERNAKRMQGTLETLKQNAPGTLTSE